MRQKPEDEHKAGKPGKKPSGDAKKPQFAKQRDIEAEFDGKPGFAKLKPYPGEHKGPGALGAKAYAMGEEIAMRNEKPGGQLLAHELTHVIQQSDDGKHSVPKKLDGFDSKKPDEPPKKLDGDRKKPDALVQKLAAADGKLPDELLHKLRPEDLKKPEKVLRKLEKRDAKKPIELPFKKNLEAAFGADFKMPGAFKSPGPMEAFGADAFAVGDAIAFKDSPDMKFAAHEATHVSQQGGDGKQAAKPKKPEYLKHPDAKYDDKSEDKSEGKAGPSKKKGSVEAKSKPSLPADSQGKLQVPLDAEILHALSEKMSHKIERDVKSELDAAGKPIAR